MKTVLKNLGLFLAFSIIALAVIFLLADPILAPTKQVKILGASEDETDQLNGFKNYQVEEQSNPANIQAASYLVKNLDDGSIVTKQYSENPLPIASLTKLMTAWVTLKYGSLTDTYKISLADQEEISPTLGLQINDEVLVSDLVNSLLIGSANDAATALGNYLEGKTGQKISVLMNQETKSLGLSNSRFQNPVGFDSISNYSSAEDIAILVSRLREQDIFSETSRAFGYSFTGKLNKTYQVKATNVLINRYSDLSAIKTGFTNTALGSMVNLLSYNNQTYLIIVIGSPDREADTLKLRDLVLSR